MKVGFRAFTNAAWLHGNYYPFGMQMPNRYYSNGYRYGYQGSEKDQEVIGSSSNYTTHFRSLDVRIGRWWSVDPVIFPWQSSYTSMDNNPIIFNDLRGDKVRIKDRETRREVRFAKRNDSQFKEKFKELKKAKEKFIFQKAKGSKYDVFNAIENIRMASNGGFKKTTFINFDNSIETFELANDELARNELDLNMMQLKSLTTLSSIIDKQLNDKNIVIPKVTSPNNSYNIGSPFNGNKSSFVDPQSTNSTLQNSASAFLKSSNFESILIVINTNLPSKSLNNRLTRTNNLTLNALMWQRGQVIRNQLIQNGVPPSAFPNNWLQFNFSQPSPSTNVEFR